jgi:hypothetical protein
MVRRCVLLVTGDPIELGLVRGNDNLWPFHKAPKDCMGPAQNYYRELWEKRTLNVARVKVLSPALVTLELGLAA